MSQKLSRRDLLKLLAASTGAVAVSSIPTKWVTPIIEIGALPAHAQGSGLGAISGNITTLLGLGSPIQKNPSVIPIQYMVGTVTPSTVTGRTVNSTFVSFNSSTGIQTQSYLIPNLPTGSYSVQLTGPTLTAPVITACGVTSPNPQLGVVVTAPATTPNINFTVDCRST